MEATHTHTDETQWSKDGLNQLVVYKLSINNNSLVLFENMVRPTFGKRLLIKLCILSFLSAVLKRKTMFPYKLGTLKSLTFNAKISQNS